MTDWRQKAIDTQLKLDEERISHRKTRADLESLERFRKLRIRHNDEMAQKQAELAHAIGDKETALGNWNIALEQRDELQTKYNEATLALMNVCQQIDERGHIVRSYGETRSFLGELKALACTGLGLTQKKEAPQGALSVSRCCGCSCGKCKHQGGDGEHTRECVDLFFAEVDPEPLTYKFVNTAKGQTDTNWDKQEDLDDFETASCTRCGGVATAVEGRGWVCENCGKLTGD